MKICSKCKVERENTFFRKEKQAADGLRSSCKVCDIKYYELNKEKLSKQKKEYWAQNKETRAEYDKNYAALNKEKIKTYQKEYNLLNKEKLSKQKKEYQIINGERLSNQRKEYYKLNIKTIKKKTKEYAHKRKKIDPSFKLACNLRGRLNKAIHNNAKAGSSVKDLGCTIAELKLYLESKFQEGMSWDNWSPTGWHIDHILPLSKFDLTNREEFLKACHYTNLQPMWAKDNMKKGDKT